MTKESKLMSSAIKFFAERERNDEAYDAVFEFYYDKGDLSAADITVEDYDKLDWNDKSDIRSSVVESAKCDEELLEHLMEHLRPWIKDED
jgi:hypothetical protein